MPDRRYANYESGFIPLSVRRSLIMRFVWKHTSISYERARTFARWLP